MTAKILIMEQIVDRGFNNLRKPLTCDIVANGELPVIDGDTIVASPTVVSNKEILRAQIPVEVTVENKQPNKPVVRVTSGKLGVNTHRKVDFRIYDARRKWVMNLEGPQNGLHKDDELNAILTII